MKIQEHEKKKKLKEAASDGTIKKKSKAQVEETLRNLTKGGKAKLLTVSVGFVVSVRICIRDFSANNLRNVWYKVVMEGMFIRRTNQVSERADFMVFILL